jgi:retron-type reverse transcriptase
MAKTYNNLYDEVIDLNNLMFAFGRARRDKTKKEYVREFESNLIGNILSLHEELKSETYNPKPLITFILRDPKTRVISKSDFRDRIVHHAIFSILEPIFDKTFIYGSCANRVGKGNLFALKRFYQFMRKVSRNGEMKSLRNNNLIKGYCFKADIKHYFENVNHEVLIDILKKKISDEKVILLVMKILNARERERERETARSITKSMPLGNLTSQFFANVYLNELDYFVKHELKAKYYIRYVDDFVILHNSKEQLKEWRIKIEEFLKDNLKLELHPQKSSIVPLSRGVDFVGFRNFYDYRLLRKRNIRRMKFKVNKYQENLISKEKIMESFQGWNAYSKWANSYGVRKKVLSGINKIGLEKV